jgi:hypothetical protein
MVPLQGDRPSSSRNDENSDENSSGDHGLSPDLSPEERLRELEKKLTANLSNQLGILENMAEHHNDSSECTSDSDEVGVRCCLCGQNAVFSETSSLVPSRNAVLTVANRVCF